MQYAAAAENGAVHVGQQALRLAELDGPDVPAVCQNVALLVCKQQQVTLAELKGKSRQQSIAEARALAMYLVRRLSSASYAQIGEFFGRRDHTTALHACRKVEAAICEDDSLRCLVEQLAIQISTVN